MSVTKQQDCRSKLQNECHFSTAFMLEKKSALLNDEEYNDFEGSKAAILALAMALPDILQWSGQEQDSACQTPLTNVHDTNETERQLMLIEELSTQNSQLLAKIRSLQNSFPHDRQIDSLQWEVKKLEEAGDIAASQCRAYDQTVQTLRRENQMLKERVSSMYLMKREYESHIQSRIQYVMKKHGDTLRNLNIDKKKIEELNTSILTQLLDALRDVENRTHLNEKLRATVIYERHKNDELEEQINLILEELICADAKTKDGIEEVEKAYKNRLEKLDDQLRNAFSRSFTRTDIFLAKEKAIQNFQSKRIKELEEQVEGLNEEKTHMSNDFNKMLHKFERDFENIVSNTQLNIGPTDKSELEPQFVRKELSLQKCDKPEGEWDNDEESKAKQNNQLNVQLMNLNNEIELTKQKLLNAEKDKAEMRETIFLANKQCEGHKKSVYDSDIKIAELRTMVDDKTKLYAMQLEQMNRENNDLRRELSQHKEYDAGNLKESYAEIAEMNEKYKAEIAETTAKVHSLQIEKTRQDNEIINLKNSNESLQLMVERYQVEHTEYGKLLSNMDEMNALFRERSEFRKHRIEQLEQALVELKAELFAVKDMNKYPI